MAFDKITEELLRTWPGAQGMADTPTESAETIKELFNQPTRHAVAPVFNALVEAVESGRLAQEMTVMDWEGNPSTMQAQLDDKLPQSALEPLAAVAVEKAMVGARAEVQNAVAKVEAAVADSGYIYFSVSEEGRLLMHKVDGTPGDIDFTMTSEGRLLVRYG